MMTAHQTRVAVAAVFAAELGVAAIDHEAGFFDLGVDSMAIVRAMRTLRESWPFLKPVDVFDHPSVAGLAAYIAAREEAG